MQGRFKKYVDRAVSESFFEDGWVHGDARARNALVMKAVFEQAAGTDAGALELRAHLYEVLEWVQEMNV